MAPPAHFIEKLVRAFNRRDAGGLAPDGPPPRPERMAKGIAPRLVAILAKNRHEERLPGIGRELEFERRPIRLKTRGRRPEPQLPSCALHRRALHNGIQRRPWLPPRRWCRAGYARRSANLEKIAKIGGKANLDAKTSGAIRVIAKTDPLITDCLPKEFGAFDRNRIARQRNDAVRMNIGVGKIDRERSIVVLNDRAQQATAACPRNGVRYQDKKRVSLK